MDSRERVLAAINHERPDRIPADLWAEPGVWERLRKDLGAASDEDVRQEFEIDIRYVSPVYPEDTYTNGIRQNMWGERWAKTSSVFGLEWEHTHGALQDARSLSELEAFPWPTCDQVDYSRLKDDVRRWEGRAIFYGNADFFERPALVRGLENTLVDVMINPSWIDFLQEKFMSFFIEDFRRTMEATGGKIDVFWALTDLGTQHGLFMGKDVMETYIFRPLKTFADVVHHAGVKLMFHSCGAVRDVIPELIECGVDILNPIQPAARGMAPDGLKRDFGSRLCFHGGIDIQYLLPIKPADAVRREADHVAHLMGNDGGYVLAPSHNIQ
ncbi:MAG TPA: uroporphyrinogen decarboxylase family protein, partial [Spirochaetia bacterium]|nr:uroporphyrinogen decarboxylase family protein [Spirochaetia bacterium]